MNVNTRWNIEIRGYGVNNPMKTETKMSCLYLKTVKTLTSYFLKILRYELSFKIIIKRLIIMFLRPKFTFMIVSRRSS